MDDEAWACIRTIIVPTGIAPVERRSPVPYRKRTPLRRHADGEPTSRAGDREWFTERVLVGKQQGHKRVGYMAAVAVHVVVVLLLTMAVLIAAEPPAARGTLPPIAPPPDVTPETSDQHDVDGTSGGVDGGVKDGAASHDGGGGGVPDGDGDGHGTGHTQPRRHENTKKKTYSFFVSSSLRG